MQALARSSAGNVAETDAANSRSGLIESLACDIKDPVEICKLVMGLLIAGQNMMGTKVVAAFRLPIRFVDIDAAITQYGEAKGLVENVGEGSLQEANGAIDVDEGIDRLNEGAKAEEREANETKGEVYAETKGAESGSDEVMEGEQLPSAEENTDIDRQYRQQRGSKSKVLASAEKPALALHDILDAVK